MFKLIDLEQGTQEWLEFRRSHVTATDSCKIMGAVPKSWGTSYTLWIDKLMSRETIMNAAMKRGIDLEPFACSHYNVQTDRDCKPVIAVSTEHPWMMASLDGLSSDMKHAVEIKCPGEKACAIARQGIVSEYYKPQLQHQMSVLGHKKIDYVVYDGTEIIIIPVERDDNYIDELIEKGKEFHDCLKSCTPPPSSEIFHEMVSSDSAVSSAQRLQDAKNKIKELTEIVDKEKAFLESIADDRNIQVGNMKVTKRIRKGNIQYKNIPELKKIDLENYRSSGTEFYQFN